MPPGVLESRRWKKRGADRSPRMRGEPFCRVSRGGISDGPQALRTHFSNDQKRRVDMPFCENPCGLKIVGFPVTHYKREEGGPTPLPRSQPNQASSTAQRSTASAAASSQQRSTASSTASSDSSSQQPAQQQKKLAALLLFFITTLSLSLSLSLFSARARRTKIIISMFVQIMIFPVRPLINPIQPQARADAFRFTAPLRVS